ncbi:MAG: polymerase sigma factor SigK [Nocardioides sp.]|nr:polymerase sigma factor SigK [Nocardioides sp.]
MTRPPVSATDHPPTLGELLDRAAHGDHAAFARLYDDTAPRVYGLVLRIVRDPALAERITLEVFLAAWRTSGTFDRFSGEAMAWLMSAAHREAVDAARTAESSAPGRYVAAVAAGVTTLVPLEPTALAERVLTALAQLSRAQREMLELVYFTGYTHAETALLVGGRADVPRLVRESLVRLRGLLAAA